MRERRPDLVEAMDDPRCDPERLRRTYAQFGRMNRWVTGWRRAYRTRIRPLQPCTLLDIGCGGGDLAMTMAAWACRDGFPLRVTAADPDSRAIEFFRQRPDVGHIEILQATLGDLCAQGRQFDVVISNHVLHHLSSKALLSFRDDSERIAKHLVLHNDLERSRVAWFGLQLMRPAFPGSYIIPDGSVSIRRSYRPAELAAILGPRWRVRGAWPYRLWAELDRGLPT